MIAEVSSVEAGGSKAEWIRDLYIAMPAANPRLRAIVWFDYDMREDPNETDWRLGSSTEAVAAYAHATSTALYVRRQRQADRR